MAGKFAIVTGASTGIGFALASVAAKAGYCEVRRTTYKAAPTIVFVARSKITVTWPRFAWTA